MFLIFLPVSTPTTLMHAGRYYSLKQTLHWTRKSIFIFIFTTTIPVILYEFVGIKWIAIPWFPIAIIGTAVAFYLGFKNFWVWVALLHVTTFGLFCWAGHCGSSLTHSWCWVHFWCGGATVPSACLITFDPAGASPPLGAVSPPHLNCALQLC